MSRIVRRTMKVATPKTGMLLYSTTPGDWVVCGGKTLMVVEQRMDGYVLMSDGLCYHPTGMRRATFMEMMIGRSEVREAFAAEWRRECKFEAKHRGLKVDKELMLAGPVSGLLPVQAATRRCGR